MSVIYLFTRFKFNWSEVEFSLFSTYAMLTSLVGKLRKSFSQNLQNLFLLSQRNTFLCRRLLALTADRRRDYRRAVVDVENHFQFRLCFRDKHLAALYGTYCGNFKRNVVHRDAIDCLEARAER